MVSQETHETRQCCGQSPTEPPQASAVWRPARAPRFFWEDEYLRRVARRPRAWVLAYLLTTIPALGLALLTALAVLPLARYPAFRQAIEAHSLDLLLDLSTLDTRDTWLTPLGALALLLVPLVGVAVKLIWIWLEGGTLADYVAPAKLSWGEFSSAGWRWFGVFLALNLIGAALLILVGGAALLPALLVYARIPTLAWSIIGVGALVAGLCATWIEIARAAALVHDERHVFRALKRATRSMAQQWRPLFMLVGVSLLLFGALYLVQHWITRLLPLPWWLLTLAIQQALLLARLGIRLARQAGQVGLLVRGAVSMSLDES
jgi:hypothetical protein